MMQLSKLSEHSESVENYQNWLRGSKDYKEFISEKLEKPIIVEKFVTLVRREFLMSIARSIEENCAVRKLKGKEHISIEDLEKAICLAVAGGQ
jgi:hypothetical protein